MPITRQQQAIATAIEQIASEKISTLPVEQQEAIAQTREQLTSTATAAGEAGDIAFVLAQLAFTRQDHKPYNGLFEDLGNRAMQRALMLDPEAFIGAGGK